MRPGGELKGLKEVMRTRDQIAHGVRDNRKRGRVSDSNNSHPIYAKLFDLQTLDVVRIIEERN